jgi:hypothetical protein
MEYLALASGSIICPHRVAQWTMDRCSPHRRWLLPSPCIYHVLLGEPASPWGRHSAQQTTRVPSNPQPFGATREFTTYWGLRIGVSII